MGIEEIASGGALQSAILKGITLVDFNAPWCAPCRLQEPIVRRLAERFHGKATIASMNIDRSRDVARDFGIHSIPTLVIFKNGKEIQRFIGLQSESDLTEALKKILD